MKQKKVSCVKIIWAECKLVLRRVFHSSIHPNVSNESYQNLEAQVQIQDQDIKQKFQPSLTFRHRLPNIQKKFFWSLRKPLPSLSVALQNCYLEKIKEDEEIIDIFSELSAAYLAKKDSHYYLEQVKLIGDRIQKFDEQGHVQFSQIKFAHSSLKKQNNKFCLIVTIYARCLEQQKVIIKSYICSQIFVCPFVRMNLKKRQVKKLKNFICSNECQIMRPVEDRNQIQFECKQVT